MEELSGISSMRVVVAMFDGLNETFNTRFTPVQLIKLWRVANRVNYCTPLDEWPDLCIQIALDEDPNCERIDALLAAYEGDEV